MILTENSAVSPLGSNSASSGADSGLGGEPDTDIENKHSLDLVYTVTRV